MRTTPKAYNAARLRLSIRLRTIGQTSTQQHALPSHMHGKRNPESLTPT